ncbi:WD repeat-containing protein 6 [Linum perenne]
MTGRRRAISGQYLGEVSALSFLHVPPEFSSLPLLLAGSGSQLLLYNLEAGSLIKAFQVFEGIRVHGIACSDGFSVLDSAKLSFRVSVFGEKRVKLFSLNVALESEQLLFVDLGLECSLPRFSHWILDVSFLKSNSIAVGCSDNSVHVWDITNSCPIVDVQSPDKCLLYSMRLWGESLDTLRIASGTIFNEIIIWRVVHQEIYKASHISRLIGHEGSIFRIAWSSDGSKLISVSDDRSARIWRVGSAFEGDPFTQEELAGPVLYGHNARVWDCCTFGSLIVTAGEDCTCRVWDLEGKQLKMIKEHIGRGVWRCLYDPASLVLITAGFDSAVKVHQLPSSLPRLLEGQNDSDLLIDNKVSTGRIPSLSEHVGLMDSKSEYIRNMHLTSEDTIYVATNHGYLYHAQITDREYKWTKLVQVSQEVPIVCMDLLSKKLPNSSCGLDDWVALGDGKGNMTVVRVIGDISSPEVAVTYCWSAGKERQLLGTYWCRSLGSRFIFTADPRGSLRLWSLNDQELSVSQPSQINYTVSLIGDFISSFGIRIMCLDASFKDEVLLCGDLRGNLLLFPLLKDALMKTSNGQETKITPTSYFKGAHGISSVSSLSMTKLSSSEIEIRTNGADGCICFFEYDTYQQSLEFIGMKQVKELSLIQSVLSDPGLVNDLTNCSHAVGFASTDFIIWNLTTEAKVVQIPCGGWRRPHSYFIGDVPEVKNCFAYVKNELIYVHRHWVHEKKIYPQNLRVQFHGREIHTLCFISVESNAKDGLLPDSNWIATGSEDGTVRLTRYIPGVESWSMSKLLGEHVGGSAVRSICTVAKVHTIASNSATDQRNEQNEDREKPYLLISVGAKRVLTSWLLRDRGSNEKENSVPEENPNTSNEHMPSSGSTSSMSFKWLSTDMPARNSSTHGKRKLAHKSGVKAEGKATMETDSVASTLNGKDETEPTICSDDKSEDDWRYLAVTAFLVKDTCSKLTICFVLVSCSDATLILRALILPHRLWFDVAVLSPLASPVLSLQHVVVPLQLPCNGNVFTRNAYVAISGATDGSIAFWDLTKSIEAFVHQLSSVNEENLTNCRTRPRTGRGSQGGRWWRSLSKASDKAPMSSSVESEAQETTINVDLEGIDAANETSTSVNGNGSSHSSTSSVQEISPLHIVHGVHQSGVNCLRVSDMLIGRISGSSSQFSLVSGGDDQALNCLKFCVLLESTSRYSDGVISADDSQAPMKADDHIQGRIKQHHSIRFLGQHKVNSAHSSAVKGVWTDGTWVFSTGLDQRVRCWLLEDHCKLTEQSHLIISVPEPEALDAKACINNGYRIAVAGRGMQIVEFDPN